MKPGVLPRGRTSRAVALLARLGASGGDIFERKKGLVVVLCCLAGSASAQMACTFETECYERDGCAEAAFSLSLDESGETPVLVTDFGDLTAEELGEGVWLAQSDGLAVLLSVGEDGAARASFHLPGPQVVAYLGMCGGVE